MNRTEAIKLEVRRAHELKLAAARFAGMRGEEEREELCRAAIAWQEAASKVVDAVLIESAGRAMTESETRDVEHVIPRLTIVRGR